MSRALVLGGGGATGIAWEVGVLQGLTDRGVDLQVDAVIGTSAGSFVGAMVANGQEPAALFARQHESGTSERAVKVPRGLYLSWVWAYLKGRRDPVRINAGFGAIARRRTPLVGVEERQRTVTARLTVTDWPEALQVVAVEATTGRTRSFTRADGLPLTDVAAASGAVPGISPAVALSSGLWIDGGMVSSTNTRFAAGYDEVLVIAPLPQGHGGVPSAADEAAALTPSARVHLIAPDAESRAAIGGNIYDAARRGPVADAGRVQGVREAERVPWQ